jgi:bacterial/archaeal transporter family-2 protein
MHYYLFFVLAFLLGVANTVQSGANSQLRLVTQSPLLTSIISFLVGLSSLLVCYFLFDKTPLPSTESLRNMAWWKWTGGLLGAFFVFTVIFTVRQIGPANLFCFMVAGQLVTATILDHYGLMGFNVHPVSVWRMLGLAMIVGGVYLVMKN